MFRPSVIVQIVLLGLLFSATMAVLTYYGGGLDVFRNRLVAAIWGSLFGFPAAVAFVLHMERDR